VFYVPVPVYKFIRIYIPATHRGYQNTVDTWVGGTKENLYMKWGLPTKTAAVGEKEIVEYIQRGGISSVTWGNVTSYDQQECITKFIINKKGIIEDYDFNGWCRQ